MLSCQNIIPCSLLFVASIPTYFLNFKILVCLLFIHASIHNNLSAGAQNVTGATGAYIIMLVYRYLLTLQELVNNALTWQSSCVIANNAWNTASYNLEVYRQKTSVKKFTREKHLWKHHAKNICEKHRATVIISRASQVYLRDVISRSRNRLSSPSKVRFIPY